MKYYNFGRILGCIFMGIFKFFYMAIVEASRRYKLILYSYSVIGVAIGVTFFLALHGFNIEVYFWFALFIEILKYFIIACFIIEFIKSGPDRKRRKMWNAIFQSIKLYTSEEIVPEYIKQVNISCFLDYIEFHSLLPLSIWKNKQEFLESYSNLKIIKIYQNPNEKRIVYLLVETKPLPENVEWNDNYINYKENILNIGISHYGVHGINLEKYPHCFIAGETGSGKSNILKCMIHQALMKNYSIVLIDFKRGVSFSEFSEYVNVCYEYDTVTNVFNEMIVETKRRLDLFRETKVDNINDYNKIANNKLRRIIIFVDELAELLKTRDKTIANTLNDSIETLTRLSRAAGIHLVMGIQRPDSTVISGQIKSNVPARLCGRFVDREPSQIMLSSSKAAELPNVKGRFLLKDDEIFEIQCFRFQSNPNNYDVNLVPLDEPKEIEGTIENTKEKDKENEKIEINFNFDNVKKQ